MSMDDLSKWRFEKAEATFKDGEELERLGSYQSAIKEQARGIIQEISNILNYGQNK